MDQTLENGPFTRARALLVETRARLPVGSAAELTATGEPVRIVAVGLNWEGRTVSVHVLRTRSTWGGLYRPDQVGAL